MLRLAVASLVVIATSSLFAEPVSAIGGRCPLGYTGRYCRQLWLTKSYFNGLFSRLNTINRRLDALKHPKGARFVLYRQKVNWDRAAASCRAKGGVLASVLSRREDAKLRAVAKIDAYWLGGSDRAHEGRWQFKDGHSLSYAPWAPHEPNGKRQENCLNGWGPPHSLRYRYKWNDMPCNKKLAYICKF